MPKIVDKAAKRDDIVQAALRVFARKGFTYTKMIDIAREAEMGKGTIYEYFRNKNDILVTAYRNYIKAADQEVAQVLLSDLSPLNKIRETLIRTIRFYGRDPDITRVFFDFWVESAHSEEQPGIDFKKIYAEYRQLARQLLDQAVAEGEVRANIPRNAPSVLVGVIEGTFLQWIIDPQAFDMSEMAEAIIDIIIKGLQQPVNEKPDKKVFL